ncbi:dienelactone hydrolase [Maribacter sp. 4U21]|uniref:dienelactone hydrolase family protein n=1 Tax=Maribacter sp. 4U21 TaxID=1889779 RepID=UPI000C157D9D|nr:dienelactone hydrolase family protein [Maribacter sp. 4U21]PIB28487.1 dienelactone hydrolase [Maribacter sp. 4U21]
MEELKKEDINQEVFDLYDDYAHNRLSRRLFMNKLSTYAVGGLTVASIMSFISPDYAKKIQISQGDSRLNSEFVQYESPKGGGTIKGLLSKPVDAKKRLPGIIVVHENRGLNPHREDVGRRAGLAGFISLAPDALTPLGGYPGNDDEGRKLQRERDRNEMLEDFIAAYKHLKSHPECNGKVGVVGFCFGGWISNMMAVEVKDLGAAVPFYGGQPKEGISKIEAPLLLHFGALDTRVNAGWPAYEEALKKNGKEYMAHVYPNANHGFHNDTTPRYDMEAAELAWKRTIEFFREKLA